MGCPGEESIDRAMDVLEFLSHSNHRVVVLSALAERGTLDRYELEDAVDATRRTVLRTVTALADRGYVEETDDGIALTALGEHVVEHYREFLEGVALDPEVEDFLARVPADALDVDVERLRDGDVTAATAGSQYAPLDRALDLREEATEIRELAPAVEHRSVTQLAERIERGEDLDAEILITEATHETAAELDQYSDAHGTVLAADAVDLAVYPGPFGLSLAILDETVILIVGAQEGETSAILETEDRAVRRWAHDVVDRHREVAMELPLE